MLRPESPITEIKGVGPKKSEAFNRLGIFCVQDCIRNFPREYEDFRNKKMIKDLVNGEKALVQATVVYNSLGRGYGRKRNLHLVVMDKTGKMDIIFFMAGFMSGQFLRGKEYVFYGKLKLENDRAVMFQPAFFLADDALTGIQPVYSLSRGLSQKDVKKAVQASLLLLPEMSENLPDSIIKKANLCPMEYAYKNIHFPENEDAFRAARYRLVFQELFDLRIALKLSADRFGSGRDGISFAKGDFEDFVNSLPYKLTDAQNKVLSEINNDMNSFTAMSRLVQGDVGSGKTVIAEAALFKAVKSGYQGALMAPTEILASQHYESFKKDFKRFGFDIEYLSGSLSAKERREVLDKLASGQCDIVIGTHAVISRDVVFNNLGLAITDEQHRFGVNQRKTLIQKGNNPDVLVMTATPIPRTLAVVLYSDLDISIIDELPPGRKEIITQKYNQQSRKDAYKKLVSEINFGRQAYIVTPIIEDSDSISAFSAESIFEEFKAEYPKVSVALLHGDMKQSEKDAVMQDFVSGKISVLVSTVVIEVGINVPNASVMLVENTERFGLAQLHQLRGRVGRGEYQSYCMLVLGDETDVAVFRADTMCNSSDGFVIAEKDLEMRGPGELFGFRQHGLPQLQLADPLKHTEIVKIASDLADELLKHDPRLDADENKAFGDRIRKEFCNGDNLVL